MPDSLPESVPGSWEPVGTRTAESTILVTTITAETTLYRPTDSAAALETVGGSSIPLRSLFAVETSFSPPLSIVGISPESILSKAAPKARDHFVGTLEDEGIDVEETRNALDFERADGSAGRWYVLDAAYPVAPDLETDVDALPAELNLAVWPTDDAYGMAGGLHPLEVPDDVTSALDGVLEGDPSLEVAPDRHRDAVSELVSALEAADG